MLFNLFSRVKELSIKKLIIILIACLLILSLLIGLLNHNSPKQRHPEGFTGGEYKPKHFVYISGSRGWNQPVSVGKYSVTLGSMLTTNNQRLIVHLIKSKLLETLRDEEWGQEGIEVIIENIRIAKSENMTNDTLEFDVVINNSSRKYLISVDFSHNPDKITIHSA